MNRNASRCKTFLDTYMEEIAPKLGDIDIYMHSGEPLITVKKTAELLYISEQEVKNIMEQEQIQTLNHHSFFTVMKKGSSELCKLFTRQLEKGMLAHYMPEDISYIYSLDIHDVTDAFAILGIHKINSKNIKTLFSIIPY